MKVRRLLPLIFFLASSIRAQDRAYVKNLTADHMNVSSAAFNAAVESQAADAAAQRASMVRLHDALSARQPLQPVFENTTRATLATGTELLVDGGFEGGYYGGSEYGTSGISGPWTWSNSPASLNPLWTDPPSHTGAPTPRTGTWCVYFNPFGPSSSRLYETVSIPPGVTASLSFWLQVGTFETTNAVAYDTMSVSIADTSGVILGSATYSNLDATSS